jgi:hypothetical protein
MQPLTDTRDSIIRPSNYRSTNPISIPPISCLKVASNLQGLLATRLTLLSFIMEFLNSLQSVRETPFGYTLLLSIAAAGFAIIFKVSDIYVLSSLLANDNSYLRELTYLTLVAFLRYLAHFPLLAILLNWAMIMRQSVKSGGGSMAIQSSRLD